jgi:hypothetical protein
MRRRRAMRRCARVPGPHAPLQRSAWPAGVRVELAGRGLGGSPSARVASWTTLVVCVRVQRHTAAPRPVRQAAPDALAGCHARAAAAVVARARSARCAAGWCAQRTLAMRALPCRHLQRSSRAKALRTCWCHIGAPTCSRARAATSQTQASADQGRLRSRQRRGCVAGTTRAAARRRRGQEPRLRRGARRLPAPRCWQPLPSSRCPAQATLQPPPRSPPPRQLCWTLRCSVRCGPPAPR